MIKNDNNLPMLFNNQGEVDFLVDALQPHHTVLEWGGGASTLEIAKRVKHIYSIEHNQMWVSNINDEIVAQARHNITLIYSPKNKEEAPGHDGTLADYRDYVEYPIRLGKLFDVVLIDGRARVECAKVAAELLAPDGVIFIHDYGHPDHKYRRYEYEVVETFLERIGGVFALHKFRKKPSL